MDLVGEYGFGMAVKVVLGFEPVDCSEDLDGDAGLNFCDDTTDDDVDTGRLDGLGTCDCVTDVLYELGGNVTAELRTRDGIPRDGDAPGLAEGWPELAAPSVGESVTRGEVMVRGEEEVVGVGGEERELKNAARAALFCELNPGPPPFCPCPPPDFDFFSKSF